MRVIGVSAALGILLLASPAASQDEEEAGSGGEIGGPCGQWDGCSGGHKFPIWPTGEKTRVHGSECKYCWNGSEEVEWEECHTAACVKTPFSVPGLMRVRVQG
jgi:hypothetical protein